VNAHITEIRTVGLPVADQDRALAFYLGTLGFEKRMDAPFGDQRWIEIAPAGSPTTIALVATGEAARSGLESAIRLTTTDVDADHAHLRAYGVDTDPQVLRMGDGVPPMFTFRDPDGNTLVIVELPS
jgi:catechol 2,3-dioxygenase-like lactoylglutathione lyase family enzyme